MRAIEVGAAALIVAFGVLLLAGYMRANNSGCSRGDERLYCVFESDM
jgi:hypothetical protein